MIPNKTYNTKLHFKYIVIIVTHSRDSDIIQMKKLYLSSCQYSHEHILALYADKHMYHFLTMERSDKAKCFGHEEDQIKRLL